MRCRLAGDWSVYARSVLNIDSGLKLIPKGDWVTLNLERSRHFAIFWAKQLPMVKIFVP
jgi:hypothetical protein